MATPLDTPVHLKERESLRLQDGSGVEVRCHGLSAIFPVRCGCRPANA